MEREREEKGKLQFSKRKTKIVPEGRPSKESYLLIADKQTVRDFWVESENAVDPDGKRR